MAKKLVTGGIVIIVLAGSVSAAHAQELAVQGSLRETALRAAAAWQPAGDRQPLAQWSRVSALAEGEDVFIATADGPPLRRRLLAADAATVTVLNDSHPALNERARLDLREVGRRSPAALLQTLGPGKVRLNDLRISAAGVFLGDARLGDVSMLVEIHQRDTVAEIRLVEWSRPRRFGRYLFGWPGLVGFSAGVMATAGLCEQARQRCSNRSYALVGGIGAVALSAAARQHDRRTPDGLVYRRDP